MSNTRPWHKKKVSSGADVLLFFFILVFGAGGTLVLKYYDLNRWYVMAWPCSMLVLYALILWLVRRFRVREDQAGDNLYYMGFLYTLASLAYALGQFSEEGGTEEIVNNFGIAVASTVLGLALRVMFNQMRQDTVEIEREARAELSEAAGRLRSELDASVFEMNAFRRSSHQSIADGLREFMETVDSALATNLERYDGMARNLADRLDKTVEEFNSNLASQSKLGEATVTAIDELVQRIVSIKAPDDLLVTKITPAMESLERAAQALEARLQAEGKDLRQMRKALDTVLSSVQLLAQSTEAAAGTLKSFDALGATLPPLSIYLTSLSHNLESASVGLRATVELNQKAFDSSNALLNSLGNPAAHISQSLEQLAINVRALQELVNAIHTGRAVVEAPAPPFPR